MEQSKKIDVTTKDKREYFSADQLEITFGKNGKEVYTISGKTERIVSFVDRYEGKENTIRFGSLSFPHLGRISFWAYKNEPERVFIGHDNKGNRTFAELNPSDMKKLHSIIMKIRNHVGHVGQYAPKAVDKRWKKLEDRNRQLEEELRRLKKGEL